MGKKQKKVLTTDDIQEGWNEVNAALNYRLTMEGSAEDLEDVRDELDREVYEGDHVVYFEDGGLIEKDMEATEEAANQDTLEALNIVESYLS